MAAVGVLVDVANSCQLWILTKTTRAVVSEDIVECRIWRVVLVLMDVFLPPKLGLNTKNCVQPR
jgi:hypothetical protein